MSQVKAGGTLTIVLVSAAVGALALFVSLQIRDGLGSKRQGEDVNAKILAAVPARQLVVMNVDATVLGEATKPEMFGHKSELYYFSRAKFEYIVDMKSLRREDFRYDAGSDVLRITIPDMQVRSYVTGERKRVASIAILASEGGSGNELERAAGRSLEDNAKREARGSQLLDAASKSAKYEISNLYEDAFRAAGKKTRVIVLSSSEAPPLR